MYEDTLSNIYFLTCRFLFPVFLDLWDTGIFSSWQENHRRIHCEYSHRWCLLRLRTLSVPVASMQYSWTLGSLPAATERWLFLCSNRRCSGATTPCTEIVNIPDCKNRNKDSDKDENDFFWHRIQQVIYCIKKEGLSPLPSGVSYVSLTFIFIISHSSPIHFIFSFYPL